MSRVPYIRLLLVEDDYEDAFILRQMLERGAYREYELTQVESVAAARRALDQQHIDLVITDFALGLESGLDVIRMVLSRPDPPPVVVITSLDQREADLACLRAGAQDYLHKGGLTPELLDRALRYTLASHQSARELRATLQLRDQMLSIISHDIRGPLGTLHATLEFCANPALAGQTEKLQQLLRRAAESTSQLLDLSGKLLEWARAQTHQLAVEPQVLPLGRLAETITLPYQSQLEQKRLQLKLEIPPEAQCWADPDTLETALRNLLSNAIKFTPEGRAITLRSWRAGERQCLAVADEGVGMPAELCEALFNSQKKTARLGTAEEKGHGLGLLLVHELVRLNRGTITVESRLEHGTTFTLALPAADPSRGA